MFRKRTGYIINDFQLPGNRKEVSWFHPHEAASGDQVVIPASANCSKESFDRSRIPPKGGGASERAERLLVLDPEDNQGPAESHSH